MKKLMGLLVLLALLLTGCTTAVTEEDATELMNAYISNMIEGTYSLNYELLSSNNRENISYDDYYDWQSSLDQLHKVISYTITSVMQYEEYTYDEIMYTNAFEVIYSVKQENYSDGKQTSYEGSKFVIVEGEELRVLDARDLEDNYAYAVADIGFAYQNGLGMDQDYQQAIQTFKKAIDIDEDSIRSYYGLAYCYSEKMDYEKMLKYVNEGVRHFDNVDFADEFKSDFYNLKGVAHENLYEYDSANDAYHEALELNPDNEYAADNLERMEE